MSQENVEVVRRYIDAWQRDSDAMIEHLDPNLVWAPVEESHTPSRGHEGARRLREGWLDNWEEHQLDVEEVLDKRDQVVVGMRLRGRGKLSGVEVELVQYSQFTVRNRRITHIYEHAARAEALEAAGLSE